MNELRIAFIGFRHGHIHSLYDLVQRSPGLRVVAACEEDEETRGRLAGLGVDVTHDSAAHLLAEVDCDAVAVGDAYDLRGQRLIAALKAGRHVIVDKPPCTSLSELSRIGQLATANHLQVGCMLTMRDSAGLRGARQWIRDGAIGAVHAVQFGGQHPLMLGSRPAWYFEPGRHGGTINDIGIHAIDGIAWATGLRFARVEAARCWNAFVPASPRFHDGAQMLLTMDNGCGVVGDVSYFAPDGPGYRLPYYWRMTFWGRAGVIEIAANAEHLELATATGRQVERRPLPAADPGGYLRAFAKQVRGETLEEAELTTAQVLASAQTALRVQAAADTGARGVEL